MIGSRRAPTHQQALDAGDRLSSDFAVTGAQQAVAVAVRTDAPVTLQLWQAGQLRGAATAAPVAGTDVAQAQLPRPILLADGDEVTLAVQADAGATIGTLASVGVGIRLEPDPSGPPAGPLTPGELCASLTTVSVLDTSEPMIVAARAFTTAQRGLSAGQPEPAQSTLLGWHGVSLAEPGSYALVQADGPLEDLVGEVAEVRVEARTVRVYVLASADVSEPITIDRRAYLALSELWQPTQRATVARVAR